jgi:hypothetical protein
MNRTLAWTLVLVMLAVVVGQEIKLAGLRAEPVTQITLHESRLLAFLQEIRSHDPLAYDSTVLNLRRLKEAQGQGRDIQAEELVVVEQLLTRLTGKSDN